MLTLIKNIIKKNKLLFFLYENLFQKPIINLYKTEYTKKVAIVYSTYHFKNKNYKKHSNYQESLVIADIFNKLGFKVNIYNNNKKYKLNYSEFDVFFGEGDLIYDAIVNRKLTNNYKVIYYATGSHPTFNNINTIKSLKRYIKNHDDFNLRYTRLVNQEWGIAATLADSVIIIGNNKTKESFISMGQHNCRLIKPTVHETLSFEKIIQEKNFELARKNILYFSSYGLIHKGLDLLLLASKKFPNITFHLCGKFEDEVSKNSILYNTIKNSANIINHGFIDITSERFYHLMLDNAFCILPSCAEGTSTAVLTAMINGGLIPIVTDECGISVQDYGITIKSLDVDAVIYAINQAISLSENDLYTMALKAYRSSTEYSITNYTDNMQRFINDATTN